MNEYNVIVEPIYGLLLNKMLEGIIFNDYF